MDEALKAIPRSLDVVPTWENTIRFHPHGDGSVTVRKWPKIICLDAEILERSDEVYGSTWLHHDGNTLYFHISNGEATYKLFSCDPLREIYWAEKQDGWTVAWTV